ncbi:basic blue protein-like [Humulus lupulus]|uniref:basic blue protein-like n=1 Tax=Humulus lupulus TaxID=3486 RepID=UPI002B4161AC|nr:basic blue protein-like [Humulus lupulus]
MATAAFGLMMLLIGHSVVLTSATKYVVGNRTGGWTFGASCNWPSNPGKHFKANDTLVFKYSAGHHNVVRVTKAGYRNCTAAEGARVYSSGNDQIKLVKGKNYFICTYPNHCTFGVRLSVTAI